MNIAALDEQTDNVNENNEEENPVKLDPPVWMGNLNQHHTILTLLTLQTCKLDTASITLAIGSISIGISL